MNTKKDFLGLHVARAFGESTTKPGRFLDASGNLGDVFKLKLVIGGEITDNQINQLTDNFK